MLSLYLCPYQIRWHCHRLYHLHLYTRDKKLACINHWCKQNWLPYLQVHRLLALTYCWSFYNIPTWSQTHLYNRHHYSRCSLICNLCDERPYTLGHIITLFRKPRTLRLIHLHPSNVWWRCLWWYTIYFWQYYSVNWYLFY